MNAQPMIIREGEYKRMLNVGSRAAIRGAGEGGAPLVELLPLETFGKLI